MKGSFTVEAAFVISLLLLIILWIMKQTIFLYQETIEVASQDCIDLENVANTFRQLFLKKELLQ